MAYATTLFSQTLSLIPRHVFQKLEERHKVGRSSRRFGFKEQFTVMAFIQLAARRSMRDGLRALTSLLKKSASDFFNRLVPEVCEQDWAICATTSPACQSQPLRQRVAG